MSQRPFRVLTIDGGGMRGLYTVALLGGLLTIFQKKGIDLGKEFDLICGTSTGAIIGSGLAAGVGLDQMQALFSEEGPAIFVDPIPSGLGLLPWVVRHLRRPSADQAALFSALSRVLGQQTFGSIWKDRKIALYVTSTDLASCSPRVFKTPHDPDRTLDRVILLVDACVASSAAPIIFPVAKAKSPQNPKSEWSMADGGLWANNPVIVGITAALEIAKVGRAIEVVSVGTCLPPGGQVISRERAGRGLWQWQFGIKALDTSLDVSSEGAHHAATFLAKSLKKRNIDLGVYRLPQSRLSGEQAALIGLDQSSPQSLSVLLQCAEKDAMHAHKDHFDTADRGGTILGRILAG